MKKLFILILIMLPLNAYAAAFLGARRGGLCPTGGWSITYSVNNPDTKPPLNPLQKVIFCIGDAETSKDEALKTGSDMTNMIEHPKK